MVLNIRFCSYGPARSVSRVTKGHNSSGCPPLAIAAKFAPMAHDASDPPDTSDTKIGPMCPISPVSGSPAPHASQIPQSAFANPQSRVTPDLVKRVSERLASCIPMRLALAGEGVTVPEYKQHLLNHPELQAILDIEKRKFLENAINMLLEGENRGVHIRWLLERFYPHALAPDPADAENEMDKPRTVAGVPEIFIKLFQEHARRLGDDLQN